MTDAAQQHNAKIAAVNAAIRKLLADVTYPSMFGPIHIAGYVSDEQYAAIAKAAVLAIEVFEATRK